jgi:hypothetical protein
MTSAIKHNFRVVEDAAQGVNTFYDSHIWSNDAS